MADRPLDPDEAALWRRVLETVTPIHPAKAAAAPVAKAHSGRRKVPTPAAPPTSATTPVRARPIGRTLDGTWDKKLERGDVYPDAIVDLHGDTLDRAYARIDAALAGAVARGDRLVLLVTGKSGVRGGRGSIRAVVGDWLAASRHAGAIAAVRPASPRHGGAGALYLVLRRR